MAATNQYAALVMLFLTLAHAQDGLSNEINPLVRQVRVATDQFIFPGDFYPDSFTSYDYPADDVGYESHRNSRFMMEPPNSANYLDNIKNDALKKLMLEFTENNRKNNFEGIKKRVLSSFRERMEKEKSKDQHEKMAEIFLNKLEQEEMEAEREYENNKDYIEMLEELSGKYRRIRPELYGNVNNNHDFLGEELIKRESQNEYPSLGWSSVGYRKRSYPSELEVRNNALDLINYYPQEDVLNRLRNEGEDDHLDRYDFLKTNQDSFRQRFDAGNRHNLYSPDLIYAKRKRYPVAKRSSNFYGNSFVQHKIFHDSRSEKKEDASGIDPKIEKDLSSIFEAKEKKKNTSSTEIKPKKNFNQSKKSKKTTDHTILALDATVYPTTPYQQEHQHKEIVDTDKPLKIKKKSVDWSKYFGIDKRKKEAGDNLNNNIDNEWLIDRYHKAVALATKKNTEYPLNFFRNKEQKEAKDKENNIFLRDIKSSDSSKVEQTKLGEMDVKLKNMEDIIIDEALKYTGAHEGASDSKEIQEVKDKVISRLAAAYSLEKMRRALSEFKTSITAQKYAMENNMSPEEEKHSTDNKNTNDKKSAASLNYVSDNKKCKEGDEIADETYYPKQPANEIDSTSYTDDSRNAISGNGDCDVIEQRCRSIISIEHGSLFYPPCKWHQACYLCSDEEAASSCDALFLRRAAAECEHGERSAACQWSARVTLEFLRGLEQAAPAQLDLQCGRSACGPAGPDVTAAARLFYNRR